MTWRCALVLACWCAPKRSCHACRLCVVQPDHVQWAQHRSRSCLTRAPQRPPSCRAGQVPPPDQQRGSTGGLPHRAPPGVGPGGQLGVPQRCAAQPAQLVHHCVRIWAPRPACRPGAGEPPAEHGAWCLPACLPGCLLPLAAPCCPLLCSGWLASPLLQVRWLDVSGMDWSIIEVLAHSLNIHPLVGMAAGAGCCSMSALNFGAAALLCTDPCDRTMLSLGVICKAR